MKAVVNPPSSKNAEVRLEHGEEFLDFSISVFRRENFEKEHDVFEYINLFWADLPSSTQGKIFSIYRDIRIGLDTIYITSQLTEFLSNKVVELMEFHDITQIQNWIAFKTDIQIPEKVREHYTHSIDENTSVEKTYIKSEYAQLVAMSLALRAMMPVWGEHIFTIRKDTGNTFKEFYSFQLLSKAPIMHSVAMEKLRTYINSIALGKYDANSTLKGISSEDFTYWILSLVVIRRLCIGDIRGRDPNSNLAAYLYRFILNTIQSTDNNFENIVKVKRFDDSKPGSDNKISNMERYKIKSNISPGEIVELEFSMKDIYNIASKLTCKCTPELLDRCLESTQVLLNERLQDPQITLLRWVLKPVISPRGLMYLPKPTLVRAVAVAQAVLWARGFYYLSLVVSAYSMTSDTDMIISPTDSKMRVPKDLADELESLYPFAKPTNSKKEDAKPTNLVAYSIDQLMDNLMKFAWKPTADENMLVVATGSVSRKLPIKPDTKSEITRLVIELGKRSWI